MLKKVHSLSFELKGSQINGKGKVTVAAKESASLPILVFMNGWLNNYEYRIFVSGWIFGLTGHAVLLQTPQIIIKL
jgi:hypothetical protein